MLNRNQIAWGGNGGKPNAPNYANCEYTKFAKEQAAATPTEGRQEAINNALGIASNDIMAIPQMPAVFRGAYRNGRVNAEFGDAGPSLINAPAFATLESKGSDQVTVKINPFQIERMNYFLLSTNSGNPLWSNLVHTPLLYYDKNLELQNWLVSSFEEGEDGKQFTFELKQDATFSNGNPVTAEDVKFTFQMINRNADKGFPYPSKIPYEAIEAIDERTIQFRLEESYAAFISRTIPRWGVLHPPSWDGVNDAPTEFAPNVDNYVNTGPFEVQALEGRQLLALEPRDEDHPLFNPDYQLLFQAFEKTSTAIEGMISGNIDIITNGSGESL